MNCLHCHSTRVQLVLRFQEQATFRCRRCKGYFNTPGPYSSKVYNCTYFDKIYTARKTLQLLVFRRYLNTILEHTEGQSLLDYGCGTGLFLAAADEAGLAYIVGADTSGAALEIARRNLGNRVPLVDLSAESLPPVRFDVIVLIDTISALPDARATLDRLRDNYLAEHGLVAIRTPDIPSRYFMVVKTLALLIGRKQASRLMFADNRFALFDVHSLQTFLALVKLRPVLCEIEPDYPPVNTRPASWQNSILALVGRFLRRQVIFILARACVD